MSLPPDPFGRTKVPATFDRAGRIRLLGEAAEALLDGREVPREAGLYLGGAVLSWLHQGGRLGALERDYLKVSGAQRSRLTPARLWQRDRCASTATHGEPTGTLAATTDEPTTP